MSELSPLKRAFIALEETRAQLKIAQETAREPIAVVGLGCRVPGGGDGPASLWRILREGVDAIGPLPAERWDVETLYHPDPDHTGTIATRGGGFLDQIDGFDPSFFGITRREAQGMDPQQRLFLEVCWEALEHAGQAPDRLEQSSTGVYVGVCASDYAYLQLESRDRGLLDAHFASGIAHSVASGRLSYLLGLRGPSLTIDTACSSSLVAVHLACQALRAGDCRMALAGGVNLILSPDLYIALSHARMLSPDGRCKAFDASADGFARGEGCGVVVLKRLSEAQADKDRILAVIRGSAVNQDGASSGLTAPSGPAQEAVIRDALTRASIAPRLVSYVEAHGTGTQLGDPLELRALGAVFAGDRPDGRPLSVGSVKTNVGHLEAAAGVTGLIKIVLALQHREIPAHLHYRVPTPHIAWDELRLQVPTALTPWEPIEGRRIAGVSSFGFSGTNAHVVLEEAPEPAPTTPPPASRRQIFVLSAFDESSLRALASRYATAFADTEDAELASLCYTAAAGRAHHSHRAVITAGSIAELRERLAALAAGEEVSGVRINRVASRDPLRLAFLFTGQGSQYAGMGRELFEGQPVFRAAIERCAAVLDRVLDRPLVEILFQADGESPLIDQTKYTQPALFALEYALACLWRTWGVKPDVVIGHSVGEYVAACLAGVLQLEDALRLVSERGRLMQSLPPGGAMAAIFAPEATVAELVARCPSTVSIAAVNGSQQTVVSGTSDGVDAICAAFGARGVRCQRLTVSHAFHSPLIDPVLDEFERAAAAVRFGTPTMPLISNVTGKLADARAITEPRYWREHVRRAVRFADGMRAAAALGPGVCLEIGPHPTLLGFARDAFDGSAPALVSSLRKGASDLEQLDEALAALFLAGASIDWRAAWAGSPVRLVDLPSYPFQRERCWFTARRPVVRQGQETGHPLLGARLQSPLRDIVQFEAELQADRLPYLRDHRVRGRLILPAAAFVEMALSAAARTFDGARAIEDLVIAEPLVFGDEEARRVQTIVRLRDGAPRSFEVVSAATDEAEPSWRVHASGSLVAREAPAPDPAPPESATGMERITVDMHRAALAARGLAFGPSLLGVESIDSRDGEALGTVTLPGAADIETDKYLLPPAMLDAALQVMAAAIPRGAATGQAYLPLIIDTVRVHRTPGRAALSRAFVAKPSRTPAETLRGDVFISDADGPVAELRGITLRAAADAPSIGARVATDLFTVSWEPVDDAAWSPPLATIVEQVSPALHALAREERLAEYEQGFIALEALSAQWIVRALRDLGWSPRVEESLNAKTLAARLGVAPRFHRLLDRLLAILEEDGLLNRTAEGFVVACMPPPGDPAAATAAVLAQHPSSRTRVELARRCGEQLAGILRGTVDPLQQLFPNGSTELASSLYSDTPEAIVYNRLIRETVCAIAGSLPAGRRLRVLEVGGGTGGTTTWVAPVLDASRTEYLFTDVGPSLVRQARERFASLPFMDFATFDLEQAPGDQLEGRQFDLILASNVVHATADLRCSLEALHSLLAPGGTLLMLEVAGFERWIDITFGLTDGWWRFVDSDLRVDYPLLTRSSWRTLLTSVGFEAGEIGGEHALSREVLLAARKPLATLPPVNRPWLIFSDRGGVGNALARRLEATGRRAVVVSQNGNGAASSPALVEAIAAEGQAAAGIVHLWSMNLPAVDDEDAASLLPLQETALGSVLATVQALGRLSFTEGTPPRLWIGTQGAQATDPAAPIAVAQSPMWGLGLALAREHPELQPTRIDLDPAAPVEAQADSLFALLGRPAAEDQYAVRAGTTFVPRLAPSEIPPALAALWPAAVHRLECSRSGVLEDLELVAGPRVSPGPGQIELQIRAAGLNFRDVMNAVGMRNDREPLGGECAGRVVAVGEGVTEFAVGDDVVAIAEGALATYAVADRAHAARLPARMTFGDAAAVPFAFMTAGFALRDCAGLQAGETALIHAAAGGVGLAAVQLARAAGATVIATAGSETKRAFLRRQGIAHVFDSRSTAFEAEVLRLTGGRGVDVVLNSLAGDAIASSVTCLAETGRFLEIGKRDIWSGERFASVRPLGRYVAIDLAALRSNDPARSAKLFRDVIADLAGGRISPLPVRAFPLRSAVAAFRFMAQARHIGKIVLIPEAAESALDGVSGQTSYLITGGLTGIGLLSAEHLVERGARHIVLVGRRAPAETASRAIEQMQARGASVRVFSADVGNIADLSRVLDDMAATMPPLRGIIHAAGALEDGALLQQTWPRFAGPLHAKVDGGWGLHVLTGDRPLDFFVMYSSIASVLGSTGQGNHAAANAFLDALAWHRRALGRPGTSISWGAWSGIGAAADRRVDERVGAVGLGPIAPHRGLELLDTAMRADVPHLAAMPVAWDKFLAQRHPSGGVRFFDRVARNGHALYAAAPATTPTTGGDGALDPDALRDASSAHRHALLLAFVTEHVARVIDAPSGRPIAVDQPLNELGLDSLMAVELRNRLSRGLRLDRSLPATLVFDHPTLEALTNYLAATVAPARGDDTAEPARRPQEPRDAVSAIDALSDEQIEALFSKRMGAD